MSSIRHHLKYDFKPLFKYIYDNFIYVYIVIKR